MSVSPSTLTFTTSNWEGARRVTARVSSGATANDGPVDIAHTIETTAMEYESVTVDDVTIAFSDETRGVRLSPSSLTVDEGGSQDL